MAKSVLVYHFVWCTHQRQPLVTADIERALYRCIEQQAHSLKCTVLAINGMPDHVHIVLRAPAVLSPAQIMKKLKGVSSTFARKQLRPGELFAWRASYYTRSLCAPVTAKVIAYVDNQKQHHADGKLWMSLETLDEDFSEDKNEDSDDFMVPESNP